MTVFYYVEKSTGKLIGYHLSTFCQIGKNKNDAKRYQCETPEEIEERKTIITNNFKSVMNTPENAEGFDVIKLQSKKQFNDLTFDDVEIKHEIVPTVPINYIFQDISKLINE